MKKILILFIVSGTFTFGILTFSKFLSAQHTEAASFTVFPEKVMQGEPLEISINGITGTSSIKNLSFDGKVLGVFIFNKKPTAFYGIDLAKKPGSYKILATFADGSSLEKTINILKRPSIQAPLGIPEKLGGNTPVAQKSLVTGLANENDILSQLTTNKRALWTGNFIFPLDNPVVADPYGYTRETGPYLIAHKGTDFQAKEGTSVKAMNRGVVRLVKTFKEYGNTVIVDHGMGLMTFYMHLSKISVSQGNVVEKGQEVGKSGQTGYAASPHLHLTVRLNNTSIDPMKFMDLFK